MPLSAIFQLSWRPVLVVEEAGVPGENKDKKNNYRLNSYKN
jgi:hypothetical protein